MPDEGEQDDDRNRHTQQPQQNSTTHDVPPLTGSVSYIHLSNDNGACKRMFRHQFLFQREIS
jgi:hypothetical protein